METKDWLFIVATLLGPILAVQAQKWVERFREKRGQKFKIFRSLMATRAARLSPEHVQALNMIDVAFYGGSFRSHTERAVLDAWKEYLDHLNSPVTPENGNIWSARQIELFSNLLYAISKDLGYSYDKVQLNKGAYSPMAHGNIEAEQGKIRELMIKVFRGEQPVKMAITDFPAHPDAVAALSSQKEAAEKITAALSGTGSIKVKVIESQS